MSKEQVFKFFNEAAKNQAIKNKLENVTNEDDLAKLAKDQGFDFKATDVDAALSELKQQPNLFGKFIEAVLEIFSPSSDDYPNIGVQPYTGDPSKNKS